MTIEHAAKKWIDGFNVIPQGMIKELMRYNPSDWEEVTLPTIGDIVYICEYGEGLIIQHNIENGTYKIEFNDEIVVCSRSQFHVLYYEKLPIYDYMWSFNDFDDEIWLYEADGIQIMSDLGLRIFESNKYGYFFGIDAPDCDSLFKVLWVPLYLNRNQDLYNVKCENRVDINTEKSNLCNH